MKFYGVPTAFMQIEDRRFSHANTTQRVIDRGKKSASKLPYLYTPKGFLQNSSKRWRGSTTTLSTSRKIWIDWCGVVTIPEKNEEGKIGICSLVEIPRLIDNKEKRKIRISG